MKAFITLLFLALLFSAFSPAVAQEDGPLEIQINPRLPGDASVEESGPVALIANFYQFALGLGAILAFGAIIYGAVRRTVSGGNPGAIKDANEWIVSALLGLLLLLGAYFILFTVNPSLTRLGLPGLKDLPEIKEGSFVGERRGPGDDGGSTGFEDERCNDPELLADDYNVPYPTTNSPELSSLISCIKNHPAVVGKNLGSVFTYDVPDRQGESLTPLCNYTRGTTLCGPCSHRIGSCHYGGKFGTRGAEAVDFGNEQIGDAIIEAARACGGDPLNEGDHIHVSTASCND